MRSKAALRFSRQTANSCDETSEIDDGAKGCESTAYEKTPSPAAGCGCRAAFGMCAGARAGQADRDQSQRQHPPGSDRPARKGRAGPDPVQSGSILMKRPVKLLMALAIAAAASGSALAQAADPVVEQARAQGVRSEEHTSELQSLMRISYAVFCLK